MLLGNASGHLTFLPQMCASVPCKIGESHKSTNRSTACTSKRFHELVGEKVTVDQVVGSSPTRATQ